MTEIFRPSQATSIDHTALRDELGSLGKRIEDLYDRMKEFEAILGGFMEALQANL